ncbi:MAG: hypothetical protein H6765_00980 [Candidatus Peribacteria bacterium]|nr:MAG: hypothetical protein H6765_00980 [Candidatus Peribacteria bacterium]
MMTFSSPSTAQPSVFTTQSVNTFDCSQVTDVPEIECEALVNFYAALGGDDRNNNENRLQ